MFLFILCAFMYCKSFFISLFSMHFLYIKNTFAHNHTEAWIGWVHVLDLGVKFAGGQRPGLWKTNLQNVLPVQDFFSMFCGMYLLLLFSNLCFFQLRILLNTLSIFSMLSLEIFLGPPQFRARDPRFGNHWFTIPMLP